jgi:hypothetical protein
MFFFRLLCIRVLFVAYIITPVIHTPALAHKHTQTHKHTNARNTYEHTYQASELADKGVGSDYELRATAERDRTHTHTCTRTPIHTRT